MAKNGFKLLDSDMHIIEPPDLWERFIDPAFRAQAPHGWPGQENPSVLEVAGKVMPRIAATPQAHYQTMYARKADRYRHAIARNYDPVSQLEAMDTEGIDVAVLFPTRGLYALATDDLEPDLAAAIARAYNDWLADFCAPAPSRLIGAAMVAPHHVDAAVAETRRMAGRGFRALFMRPNVVHGRNWHDPHYDPLWAEAERLGMAVCFNEGGLVYLPQVGARFPQVMLHHACTHPMEMMQATVDIVGGGVLARFPGLRVGFLEGNCSWVPFLLWRLDEHYEWRREWDAPNFTMTPTEYFKRQCYVSVDCDEEPAKYAVDWLQEGNIVFSTDYPHADAKYPEASERFLKLPLSDSAKRKIMWDNCARLYGMDSGAG